MVHAIKFRADTLEKILKKPVVGSLEVRMDELAHVRLIERQISDLCRYVNIVPSAEPERKKGKWLPHPSYREWDVCSVCGIGCKRREYEIQYGQERETEYGYPFCPHCGAEMKK